LGVGEIIVEFTSSSFVSVIRKVGRKKRKKYNIIAKITSRKRKKVGKGKH